MAMEIIRRKLTHGPACALSAVDESEAEVGV